MPVRMEQNIGNNDVLKDIYDDIVNVLDKINKRNRCSQCDFGNFRKHLKMHSGEKSNKCNLCDFASSQAQAI